MANTWEMDQPRRYAVIGTGALGGYYGGKLAHAGVETHFLLRSDYRHVCGQGLRVESVDGDFHLPDVHAYNDPAAMPPCDVVLLCLKATQNHLLGQLLPPVLAEDGVVVVMQNGLGVEGQVAQVVGADRVLGCLCFLCSNKIAPGHIKHLEYGWITLGEHRPDGSPGGTTDRLNAVAADFARAGVQAESVDDLLQARWRKLVWNIPYNGLSVVLGSTTDKLMADPPARALVEAIMREVQAGAASAGKRIEDEFLQHMLAVTEKMTPYRTSMMIDWDEGRPMEVEAIFGEPVRVAAGAGTELPRIEMLYRQLSYLDRSAGRANPRSR